MQRVLVLDSNKRAIMPCHAARARRLLRERKAAVYRYVPFTIILLRREYGVTQSVEVKLDPGSKTTGVALVLKGKTGHRTIWAAHLGHRGAAIVEALNTRRTMRRSRRSRKTRYRAPRFDNRRRPQGWLAPSLYSRVTQINTWVKRLLKFIPINSLAIETVRFDTQQLQNPEIHGIEYQQGVLFGYELREYLLEKWQRTCAYCDKQNTPLEVEHIQAKSQGGSNRISNLTLSCRQCNIAKGNQNIQIFLAHNQKRLNRILKQSTQPLKDAAAVNATRYAIGNSLKQFALPISFWSGGRTKFNRTQQKYHKEHFIDAACVGETGIQVYIPSSLAPLKIVATGRGSRQMCRVDRFGFPRTTAKSHRLCYGYKTGDLVRATVTKGKKLGRYTGRVAVRTSGNFNVNTLGGIVQGINHKYCELLHRADGYNYYYGGGVSPSG